MKQGNVLGMMPHPERAVEEIIGGADGLDYSINSKKWRETHVTA